MAESLPMVNLKIYIDTSRITSTPNNQQQKPDMILDSGRDTGRMSTAMGSKHGTKGDNNSYNYDIMDHIFDA